MRQTDRTLQLLLVYQVGGNEGPGMLTAASHYNDLGSHDAVIRGGE